MREAQIKGRLVNPEVRPAPHLLYLVESKENLVWQ